MPLASAPCHGSSSGPSSSPLCRCCLSFWRISVSGRSGSGSCLRFLFLYEECANCQSASSVSRDSASSRCMRSASCGSNASASGASVWRGALALSPACAFSFCTGSSHLKSIPASCAMVLYATWMPRGLFLACAIALRTFQAACQGFSLCNRGCSFRVYCSSPVAWATVIAVL